MTQYRDIVSDELPSRPAGQRPGRCPGRCPGKLKRLSLGLLAGLAQLGCGSPAAEPGLCSVDPGEAAVAGSGRLDGHALALKTFAGLVVVDSAGRRGVLGSGGVASFSWDRDGTGFFVTREGILGFLPIQGGEVQEIYSGWSQARFPAVSPDGETLAVSANMTDDIASGWEIWLLGRDGENARMVAPGYDPSWSPDGTKLYFEQHYLDEPPVRLAVFELATGRTTPFLAGSDRDFSIEISPLGTYAAFSRGSRRDLMLYTFRDSALVALTGGSYDDRSVFDRFVSFSPDEESLVFFRQVESSGTMTFQIMGCELATGTTSLIEEGEVSEALIAPGPAPDQASQARRASAPNG